jgi:hypothetical protein
MKSDLIKLTAKLFDGQVVVSDTWISSASWAIKRNRVSNGALFDTEPAAKASKISRWNAMDEEKINSLIPKAENGGIKAWQPSGFAHVDGASGGGDSLVYVSEDGDALEVCRAWIMGLGMEHLALYGSNAGPLVNLDVRQGAEPSIIIMPLRGSRNSHDAGARMDAACIAIAESLRPAPVVVDVAA